MEDTEVRWSPEQVLALAPDAASNKAGAKLGVPGPWSGTGTSPAAGGAGPWVWGECRGSGAKPYRAVADLGGPPAFRCTCPSRKFPCKHALGLLLLWSHRDPAAGFPAAGADAAPDWVREWRDARSAAGERRAAATGENAAGKADPQAARRRAERRAKRVADGVSELEQRLADQIRTGFAATGPAGWQVWDEVAARMVDAQAPGLASRAREFAAIPGSGGDWPSRMLEEHGLLHLLARGHQAGDALPRGLAATVRARVGFTTDSAELLAGPAVRDRWLVLARQDSAEGRLTTRRTWLLGAELGRSALLLSFGAAGRSPELSLPVGRTLDAELAFHPGASPLRAVLGERHGEPGPGTVPPGVRVGEALDGYGRALAADPWLEGWPVVLAGVVPIPAPTGWQLSDADGGAALPVDPRRLGRPGLWRLAATSGGAPVTVFGSLGHRGFTPLTTWSADDAEPAQAVTL
ncbi:SWIM zinc finger family protein [Streptantibioticus silvisoli]|uniref:SWIM zinc finger domain-containing protein n=1 Tax=Streptantibioticus silvisoli TaxID=2705255 RepID=A0ABT6W5A9_9ACTN|nr:SWIM zinc finger family protein [Streptantibioticus silvisoli]MDI5965859.1 SWIM zinc finger domain-containing protein [Streptantibioticus silvisoli]